MSILSRKSKTFILRDGRETEVEVYSVDGHTLYYSINGGPIESFVFSDIITEGKKTVYKLTPAVFVQGDRVRCKYSFAEIESMTGPLKDAFWGREGELWRNIQKELFTIDITRCHLALIGGSVTIQDGSVTEQGEPVQFYQLHLSDSRGINIPESWLVVLSDEEKKLLIIKDRMSAALSEYNAVRTRDRAAALDHFNNLARQYMVAVQELTKASSTSPLEYLQKRMNMLGDSLNDILKDKRCAGLTFDGRKVVVTTDFLMANFQGDIKFEYPLGRVKIMMIMGDSMPHWEIAQPGVPYHRHPHEHGGGICVGNYRGAYERALAANDFYTAFNIVVEVLCNINTGSLGTSLATCFQSAFKAIHPRTTPSGVEDKLVSQDKETWDKFREYMEKFIPDMTNENNLWKAQHPKPAKLDITSFSKEDIEKAYNTFFKQ